MNTIKKLLPDQGVALKGYLHKKKPGLGRNWEKMYCVLTYQALYFTGMEDNKDYSGMLPIYPDAEAKLSETKKGKNSKVPVSLHLFLIGGGREGGEGRGGDELRQGWGGEGMSGGREEGGEGGNPNLASLLEQGWGVRVWYC
jgi:hypothetical protein